MNLWLRLIFVVVRSVFLDRLSLGRTSCNIHLLAAPTDIDLNGHVNNGRYLTIFDLNRLDLFIRTGLFTLMRRNKWMPLIAEQEVRYKKALKMFQRFTATLELTHWDEKYFYVTHRITSGSTIYVEARSKNVVYSRSGVVSPQDVFARLAEHRKLPAPTQCFPDAEESARLPGR